MLKNCNCESILEFKIRNIDGERLLLYSYDYKISLKDLINYDIRIEFFIEIFKKLINIKDNLKEYMLTLDDLILDAEYIYFEQNNVKFIYMPDYNKNIYDQLKLLVSEILNHVDYSNKILIDKLSSIYNAIENKKDLEVIYDIILEKKEINMSNKEDFCYDYYEDDKIYKGNSLISKYKNKVIIVAISIIILTIISYINLESELIFTVISFLIIFFYIIFKYQDLQNYLMKNKKTTRSINKNNLDIILESDIEININKFPFIIGSDIECDFVISDLEEFNVKIFLKNKKTYIKNIYKSNNIFLNNLSLSKTKQIFLGDRLEIGHYEFVVKN